jgi:nucleolar protein 53
MRSPLEAVPVPTQVLTSDEVGQGLRRLKAFPMLATERFKSLQKRGLVEPRRPVGQRERSGKRVGLFCSYGLYCIQTI